MQSPEKESQSVWIMMQSKGVLYLTSVLDRASFLFTFIWPTAKMNV